MQTTLRSSDFHPRRIFEYESYILFLEITMSQLLDADPAAVFIVLLASVST